MSSLISLRLQERRSCDTYKNAPQINAQRIGNSYSILNASIDTVNNIEANIRQSVSKCNQRTACAQEDLVIYCWTNKIIIDVTNLNQRQGTYSQWIDSHLVEVSMETFDFSHFPFFACKIERKQGAGKKRERKVLQVPTFFFLV